MARDDARHGHACSRARARLLAGVLAFAATWIQVAITSAQEHTFRLAVRTGSAQEKLLFSHLLGQLSDVAVEIVPVTLPRTKGDADAAFDPAQVAREHWADAVLWFERRPRPERGLVVQLWAVASGALPARTVEVQPTKPGARGSDMFETAALVARTSVAALVRAEQDRGAQGASLGPAPTPPPAERFAAVTATGTVAAKPSAQANAETSGSDSAGPAASVATGPAAEPAESQAVPTEDTAPPAELEEEASAVASAESVDEAPPAPAAAWGDNSDTTGSAIRLQPRFFVGLQSVVDGVSEIGQHALALRFGLQLQHFGLSVFGSAGFGSGVSDAFVDLHLTRHSAGVALDAETQLYGVLHGSAGVHAGAAFYMRSGAAKDIRVGGMDSSLQSAFVFGPEVALELRSGWLGLGLHFALDILPEAPTFQADTPVGEAPAPHSPWAFEPRISLGLEGRL